MDVLASLQTVFFLSRVVGLAPLEIRQTNGCRVAVKSRWLFYYSGGVLLIAVVAVMKEMVEEVMSDVEKIGEPMWSIARVLNVAAFFTSCLQMTASAVVNPHIYKALNLAGKLEKAVGGSVCEETSVNIKRVLCFNLISFCLCLSRGLVINIAFLRVDTTRMVQIVCFYVFLFLMNVYAAQFLACTHLLRALYRRINDMLCESETVIGSKLVGLLQEIRRHDLSLKDFLHLVSLVYMWFILFYIAWISISVIHGTMYVIQADSSVLNFMAWALYYNGQVMVILFACSSVEEEAEKTANYLIELFIGNDDSDLKEEIEIFSLQLLHRKVEFNACGFFKLNFTLFYSLVGTITTYIIILIQFQGDDKTEFENCKDNCTYCKTV